MVEHFLKDPKQAEAEKNKKPAKAQKYLFDQHHFDHDVIEEVDEEEELPPPPPTFSEEDLANAKRQARSQGFEEGQKQALEESMQTIEHDTKLILEGVHKELTTLLSAERQRYDQFEQDTLLLTNLILDKLFPALKESCGFEELMAFVHKIVKKHDKSIVITIYTNAALAEPVQKRLMEDPKMDRYTIQVQPDDQLNKMDCRIEWENGEAVFDVSEIEKQIKSFIHENLALPTNKDHNEVKSDDKEQDTSDEMQS